MKCTNCGRDLESDAKFCKHCGAKVEPVIVEPVKEDIQETTDADNSSFKAAIGQTKRPSKKLVVATSIGLFIIFFLFLNLNNPVNKYFGYINNGRSSEAIQLFDSKIAGNQSKEEEVKSTAIEKITKIESDFVSRKIDYSTAIDGINKYSFVYVASETLKSASDNIVNLNRSRESYAKAVEFEKVNDISNALREYSEVIDKDENFKAAQDKINQLKETYKTSIIAKAESLAKSNNYQEAISTLNGALEILKNESTLVSKRDVYTVKLNEIKAAEEAALREKQRLYSGKTINKNGFSLVYKTTRLTTEIVPDNASGWYLYYDSNNNEIYFDVVFTVKNTSNSNLKIADMFNEVVVKYNNSYTYTSFASFYSEDDDISVVYDWDSIEPLRSVTYHLTVTLPREVNSTSYPLSITFNALGEKQFLQFR